MVGVHIRRRFQWSQWRMEVTWAQPATEEMEKADTWKTRDRAATGLSNQRCGSRWKRSGHRESPWLMIPGASNSDRDSKRMSRSGGKMKSSMCDCYPCQLSIYWAALNSIIKLRWRSRTLWTYKLQPSAVSTRQVSDNIKNTIQNTGLGQSSTWEWDSSWGPKASFRRWKRRPLWVRMVSRDKTSIRTQTRPAWMEECPYRMRKVRGKTVERAAPREF